MTNPIFKPTDFVQVETPMLLESGEPTFFWRNALYVGCDRHMYHKVTYTDGTQEVLNEQTRIRRVRSDA